MNIKMAFFFAFGVAIAFHATIAQAAAENEVVQIPKHLQVQQVNLVYSLLQKSNLGEFKKIINAFEKEKLAIQPIDMDVVIDLLAKRIKNNDKTAINALLHDAIRFSRSITLLGIAAFLGKDNEVKFLCDKYPKHLNQPTEKGVTPLMLAVHNGRVDTVKMLLARNADRYLKNYEHKDAYEIAFEEGYRNIAKILYENSPKTDLARVILWDDVEAVERRIKSNPALLNQKNEEEETPFMTAVLNDRIKIAEYLFELGADIFVTTSFGQRAFDLAEKEEMRLFVKECEEKREAQKIEQEKKKVNKMQTREKAAIARKRLEEEAEIQAKDQEKQQAEQFRNEQAALLRKQKAAEKKHAKKIAKREQRAAEKSDRIAAEQEKRIAAEAQAQEEKQAKEKAEQAKKARKAERKLQKAQAQAEEQKAAEELAAKEQAQAYEQAQRVAEQAEKAQEAHLAAQAEEEKGLPSDDQNDKSERDDPAYIRLALGNGVFFPKPIQLTQEEFILSVADQGRVKERSHIIDALRRISVGNDLKRKLTIDGPHFITTEKIIEACSKPSKKK